MSRAVVICSGHIENYEYIKSFIDENDFVICADGGLAHAKKMGVVPNLTVGDFDSYKGEVTGEVRRFKPEKDYTDSDIAVKAAIEKGFDEILLLAASGTRLDHTLANIGLLEYILLNGKKGTLIDDNNIVTVINCDSVIERREGWHLSLIPIGAVKGVTLENLKYPLDDYTLEFSQARAVSNEFTDKNAVIRIKEGSLIVIKSRG